jgi:aminoglycoside phosphotransferase (APT) family kinase protein
VLADELLAFARAATGSPELTYAEPPVRLGGGFFTDNHAFRLAGARPPWDGAMVVRLFPAFSPPELALREATVQTWLAEQGYPAPRVVCFDADARVGGRRFFVMERLPGRALLGDIRPADLVRSLPQVRRLPVETASLQARLHALDPTELVARLGGMPAGIERWFAALGDPSRPELGCLRPALDWLVAHRPRTAAPAALCHGDLWPGNILAAGGDVTGVVDWSVATVSEPSLDIGFTAMSFVLAPVDAPPSLQRVAAALGRAVARRYVRAYGDATGIDLSNQPYYEALRCAVELGGVVRYRVAAAGDGVARPTWDSVVDRMVDYFRARTGVTLRLPPPRRAPPTRYIAPR